MLRFEISNIGKVAYTTWSSDCPWVPTTPDISILDLKGRVVWPIHERIIVDIPTVAAPPPATTLEPGQRIERLLPLPPEIKNLRQRRFSDLLLIWYCPIYTDRVGAEYRAITGIARMPHAATRAR